MQIKYPWGSVNDDAQRSLPDAGRVPVQKRAPPRGTLARWWQDDNPSPPRRVLRARIPQAQHDFTPAAADLRAALRDAPDTAQALLVLVSIDEVSGDLTEAGDACARLAALRPGLAAAACAASIGSLTGAADASEAASKVFPSPAGG